MIHKFQRYFILSASLLISMSTVGQNFSFSQFENEKDSVLRCEMAIEGNQYYRRNNIDSLRVLALSLMPKEINESNLYQSGLASRFLGTFSIRRGNIEQGIRFFIDAKEVFTKYRRVTLLSETDNEIGNAYYLLGNYYKAVSYYFASIVHGQQSSDVTARYNGLLGLGKTVCAIGDTSKGIWFVQKYLERSLRDEKFEAAADASGYLGMIAGARGKVELMSAYYGRAIIYANRSDSKTHRANALTNKAIDYFYHNKVDSSIYLFKESLKIREQVGATRPIVESLYNLSVLNIEMENLAEAKKYAKQGEELSSERGIRSWQLDCLRLLLEIAEGSNDLSNVESIKFDIQRIEKELSEMSTLDDEIVNMAIQLTSLDEAPDSKGYLWEVVSVILIILTSSVLFYSNRSNLA